MTPSRPCEAPGKSEWRPRAIVRNIAEPMLSLQTKLDLIARERAVLALLRELAAAGLREGDCVRNADTGEIGRLTVLRAGDAEPRAMVVLPSGAQDRFDARWRREG